MICGPTLIKSMSLSLIVASTLSWTLILIIIILTFVLFSYDSFILTLCFAIFSIVPLENSILNIFKGLKFPPLHPSTLCLIFPLFCLLLVSRLVIMIGLMYENSETLYLPCLYLILRVLQACIITLSYFMYGSDSWCQDLLVLRVHLHTFLQWLPLPLLQQVFFHMVGTISDGVNLCNISIFLYFVLVVVCCIFLCFVFALVKLLCF